MNTETRVCQNCKWNFTIEPEDFDFYKKIQVPPPTWCPKCRLQRRLSFFNLFTLYRRKCDLCGELKVSSFPPGSPYRVYCPQCWWSDDWDPLEYSREYDFSKPFFEQFNSLLHEAPLLGISIDLPTSRESPFNHHAGHLKNCYLLFFADFCEDSAYGFYHVQTKALIDCSLASTSELCYDSMHIYKCSRGIGLRSHVTESIDCAFLKDCSNCQNCFASANLYNKKYHIFNKPYSKEEYFAEIKKWDLGSYKTYEEVKKLAETHWRKFTPKPRFDELSVRSTGNYVFESKNCRDCYEVVGVEDSRFLLMTYTPPIKDCYDYTSWGNNVSLMYECCVSGEYASNLRFCQESGINLYNAEYCKLSTGGSDHFGCVSMKKGKHCILNKPYTEREFQALREKIITHMTEMPYTDKKGRIYRYGEFFPFELSPHPYNDTVAQRFFPLSKEQAVGEGLVWQEPESREYTITKKASEIPDHIKDAADSILNETIGCLSCSRGFKITNTELRFLRKMNVPLPRKCPFCRIEEKFSQWMKNLAIKKRLCDKCGSEFETSYSKEEAPNILCKTCYLQEVV